MERRLSFLLDQFSGASHVLVLQPAALAGLAAFRQLLPQLIDFFLRFAVDGKRNGLGELEIGAAIDCLELLSVEPEGDSQNSSWNSRPGFGVTLDVKNLGVLEDRDVEVNGLFGAVIEPQARGDL